MSATQPDNNPVGDKTYNLSGDFRGAILNIESTFVNSSAVQDIEGLPPEPGAPPYKGLQYFDEADAPHFLGREALTARLSERLRETRFLAVIGASGSGKSSLVRAGLVPALRQGKPLADGALPPAGSDQWLICVLTPTTHPLDALAVALLPDSEPAAVTAHQFGRNGQTQAKTRGALCSALQAKFILKDGFVELNRNSPASILYREPERALLFFRGGAPATIYGQSHSAGGTVLKRVGQKILQNLP